MISVADSARRTLLITISQTTVREALTRMGVGASGDAPYLSSWVVVKCLSPLDDWSEYEQDNP